MTLDSRPMALRDPVEPAESGAIESSPVPLDESAAFPTRSPRHRLVLRLAIIAGLIAGLLIAGGGVDGAQHAFAHMVPADPYSCGGG